MTWTSYAASILVGLFCLTPHLLIRNQDPAAYLPIHYSPTSLSDNYFYYMRVREVTNGNIFSGDRTTLDFKAHHTPHSSYLFSILAGAIPSLINTSTEFIFLMNQFILPALSMLLLLKLLHVLGLPALESIAVAATSIYLCADFDRFPNVQATNIFLSGFTILICLIPHSLFLTVMSGLLLGILPATSLVNGGLGYFITFAFLLVYFQEGNRRNHLLYMLSASALPLLILGLTYWMNRSDVTEWLDFAIPPVDQYRGFRSDLLLEDLKQFGWLLGILILGVKFREMVDKKITAIVLGVLLFYVATSIFHGSFLARYAFLRGGNLLILAAGCLTFLALIKRAIPNLRQITPIALMVTSMSLLAFGQITKKVPFHFSRDLKELLNWTSHLTSVPKTALTIDMELHLALLVYTNLNTDLPWAQLSPAPARIRNERFLRILRLHGYSETDAKDLFSNMKSHALVQSAGQNFELGLIQLILFYGRYFDRPMRENEIEAIMKNYSQIPADLSQVRPALFLLNKHMTDRLKPGSRLSREMRQQTPVFENATYQAYLLGNEQ